MDRQEYYDVIKLLKKSLRIELDYQDLYVGRIQGVKEISATLYVNDEEINRSKLYLKDGEHYPAGEDGLPWEPSNGY